jgi:hypothetical protein
MSNEIGSTLKLNNPALFKSQAYINGSWEDAEKRRILPGHNGAIKPLKSALQFCADGLN